MVSKQVGVRAGIGYDVHAFCGGDSLVLGGVRMPHSRSLLGHSDADVLVHAMMDAVLGAAGEPDIGALFPDSDPAYKGISSLDLASKVAQRVAEAGLSVINIDSMLLAESPRIGDYRREMICRVSAAFGIQPSCVGIKATTNEGLGFIGREEGIAAFAVALLEQPHVLKSTAFARKVCVKVFGPHEHASALEAQVNGWLAGRQSIGLLDVKYHTAFGAGGLAHSVMLMYSDT